MYIGFSTGSIAHGDFNLALSVLSQLDTRAIELSALREDELKPLCLAMDNLDLSKFEFISLHAPSKLKKLSEKQLATILKGLADKNIPIIVHPDIIKDYSLWQALGNKLCIENMDKRKPCGRTVSDLNVIFQKLPNATFCLDVAHAKQVDPTMTECYLMIKEFKDKLIELHVSDVTSDSKHVPLNKEAIVSYGKIIKYLPKNIPIILESTILPGIGQVERIEKELKITHEVFEEQALFAF